MRVRLCSPLRHGRHLFTAAALGAALVTASACDDSTAPATPFTVSGTLAGAQLAALPVGARVVVLWVVTSGSEDYAYVYGGGTIDRAARTFTVRLPNRPPRDALNSYDVGVGIVLAVHGDAALPTGRVTDFAVLDAASIGAAGQYAVIYKGAAATTLPLEWIAPFPRGYAVGRGIDLFGSFDGFEPVSASSVQLIIDAIGLIEFVNWT